MLYGYSTSKNHTQRVVDAFTKGSNGVSIDISDLKNGLPGDASTVTSFGFFDTQTSLYDLKKDPGQLNRIQDLEIENRMKKILNLRKTAQPTGIKTGGSTFKNPIGHKAWKLIDQAGCRGLKIGDAIVSDKHCNFIINLKNSSAQQIEELGKRVKLKVFETSGIQLNWEIQRVGIK